MMIFSILFLEKHAKIVEFQRSFVTVLKIISQFVLKYVFFLKIVPPKHMVKSLRGKYVCERPAAELVREVSQCLCRALE